MDCKYGVVYVWCVECVVSVCGECGGIISVCGVCVVRVCMWYNVCMVYVGM